jgi:hypothetical protein
MRAELLQPVLAELVDIWLSNCEMRALEFAHLHFLSANWMQLEETVNFNRDAFEIAEDAEWHLEMVSESHEGGYSSARVELVFPNQRVEIGRGRAKVPQRTKVCGRFLAERIAAADAGAYIRTIGGTVRDTMTETKLPLEASCEACAARLAAMTPPEVKVEEGGSKGASAGSGGGKTISSGAQLPPAAPLPRQILHKHVACRAERPPGVTGPEIR